MMIDQYSGQQRQPMSYVERLRRMRQMQQMRRQAMLGQRQQQGIGSPQGLGGLRSQPAPNPMAYQNANQNAAFQQPQPVPQAIPQPMGNNGGADIPPMGGNPYSPTMGQGWNLQNMIRRNRQNYGY